MSAVSIKAAARELEDDLSRLRSDLKSELADLISDESAAEAADAFNNFDREVERMWRLFRQALARSEGGVSS
jgi:hypothetical protein